MLSAPKMRKVSLSTAGTVFRVNHFDLRCRSLERGQRNVGVVSLYRIAEALSMRLSELFA